MATTKKSGASTGPMVDACGGIKKPLEAPPKASKDKTPVKKTKKPQK